MLYNQLKIRCIRVGAGAHARKRENDMPSEQTLSMIKPDGVARGLIGDVIGRFEKAGLKIRAMKMLHLSLDQAQAFYAVHQERPFYDSLTTFMSSGPIVAMILEGENAIQVNRDLMGATDYRQGRARHHPGRFRQGHRGQHRPRLRRPRDRQNRDRLLF